MAKGRKTYRSMRGKSVDMDLLMKKNELTPAVGNARVNARGDELGPGGQIVKKREDIVGEYYSVVGTAGKDGGEEVVDVQEVKKAAKKTTTKKPDPVPELTAEEEEMIEEAAAEDDWIEDADGNFVKKES